MMNPKPLTLPTLLQQLTKHGHRVERQHLGRLSANSESDIPWYLQLLSGIGVSVAFVLFLLLLGFLDFFELPVAGQVSMGVVFMVMAIGMYRYWVLPPRCEGTWGAALSTQVSFLFMLTGKFVVFYYVADYVSVSSAWQLVLLAGILTAVTFPWYRLALEHIVSLAVVIYFMQLAVPEMLLLVVWGAMAYLTLSAKFTNYQYVRFAWALSIFLYLSMHHEMAQIIHDIFNVSELQQSPYRSFVLALILIASMVYVAGRQQLHRALMALALALLVLAYFLPETLFFALLLMVLGYATHDKLFLSFGLLLLPFYLFDYYYSLKITLLHKSLLLMASGLVLLCIAAVIAKMGWHQEETS